MRDVRMILIGVLGLSAIAAKLLRAAGTGRDWPLAPLGWWPSFAFVVAVPLLLSVWALTARRPVAARRRLFGGAVLGALAYEASQGALAQRQTFAWADVAAITTGALLGWWLEARLDRADQGATTARTARAPASAHSVRS